MWTHHDPLEWRDFFNRISGLNSVPLGKDQHDECECNCDHNNINTRSDSNENEEGPFLPNDSHPSHIVTPDRVVYLIGQDHPTWEEEALAGSFLPPLFEMDVRDDDNEDEYASEHDGQRSKEEKNKKKKLLVMTIHLKHPPYFTNPKAYVADLAATIACLRQHLLLWYSEATVDAVFMGHGRAKAVLHINDVQTDYKALNETLATYEAVRRGDWLIGLLNYSVNTPRFVDAEGRFFHLVEGYVPRGGEQSTPHHSLRRRVHHSFCKRR